MNPNSRNRRDNIRVRDALIEDIFQDRNAGYVTISYGEMGNFNMIHIMVVELLVSQSTLIRNESGRNLRLRDLEVGMTVDAEFSNMMTASEPPKASAYEIIVVNETKSSNVKVDKIIEVDVRNSFFVTGNPNNPNNQIRFNVSPDTIILDRRGNRISLRDLRSGQRVRVEHASFMTFSIPPQTTAYRVQVI
jgi:hypothetical protein